MSLVGEKVAKNHPKIDKAPRLSIRIVILILPSDTLFGDCICFDHPNSETAKIYILCDWSLLKKWQKSPKWGNFM